jgi:hypothetical protein
MADFRDAGVSVVIPCHSQLRWPQLVEAVGSVLAQRPAPVDVVVTVDHNSELFDRARREWPELTVLENRFERGASGNRNTGVFRTDTPLIALLDDDASARPGWLAAMLTPFADPSVVGTGGTIVPRWAGGRPAWFPDELLWAVVGTGDDEEGPTTVRNVWSASMAVRRETFDAAGGFRAGFGKDGNRPRPEDTDLCLRMSSTGAGHWVRVPDAVVDHLVPAGRATLRAVIARCYHEGRGKVELARVIGDRTMFGIERDYMRRILPRAFARGLLQTARGRGLAPAARSLVLLVGAVAAGVGALVETLCGRRSHARMPEVEALTRPVARRE